MMNSTYRAISTYLLTFLLGWSSYSLKLVSIQKLIEHLSLKAFPPLILIQGILTYVFLKTFSDGKKKFPRTIAYLTFISFGAMVVAASHPAITTIISGKTLSLITNCFFFIFSSLGVISLEIIVKEVQGNNVSVLKNPNISGQLCLALELGTIFGAFGTILLRDFNIVSSEYLWNMAPFMFGVMLLPFLVKKGVKGPSNIQIQESELKKDSDNEKDDISLVHYPFVPFMILMAFILLASKHFQGFAVLLGMMEFKQNGSSELAVIFSKINIIQTILTIAILVPSFFKSKKNTTWGSGVKLFLGIQSASMGILVLFSPASMLVGTGILRKLMQRGFLNKSLTILESSIPKKVRSAIKEQQEKYAQTFSNIALAFFTALTIYGPVPTVSLWIVGMCLGLGGIWVRKRLLETVNDYQVANLVKANVYDAVASCYSLANTESSKHYMALINLLESNPRPLLAKSIIYALGKMDRKQTVDNITSYYLKHDREDIQLVSIQALLSYPSHKVDLFFTRCLNELLTRQKSLGELRISVFKALSVRIKNVAILNLLEIMEKEKEDPGTLANAIMILGEIAQESEDEELYHILSGYLDAKYPRRIRTNAILYLYRSEKYGQQALECLDSYLTSNDFYDRTAVAFLVGNLELRGLLPFVLQSSIDNQHKNSTLLVSLIKLGHKEACNWFVDLVMNSDEKDSLTALNQFNTVKSEKMRYLVYAQVLIRYTDRTADFLEMLRKTRRNFDKDRQVIRDEAERLGINLNLDDQIFSLLPEDQKNDSKKEEVIPLKVAS